VSLLLLPAPLPWDLGAVAVAQGRPSASETALAREQYNQGMAAARANRWEDAYRAFMRSYELVRRPLLLLNLASAEEQTGRLVEAAEHYRQFLREVTSGREAEQRPTAEQGLARVEPRIPRVRVVINGLRDGDTVWLDDGALSTAALDAPLPLNPGSHVLVVRSGDVELGRASFELAEGTTREVALTLDRPATRSGGASGTIAAGAPRDVRLVDASSGDDGRSPVDLLSVDGGRGREGRAGARDEDGGVLASPVFWAVVGVLVVGSVTAGLVIATSGGLEPFSGNLGSVTIR
jgi:hypothetical protein